MPKLLVKEHDRYEELQRLFDEQSQALVKAKSYILQLENNPIIRVEKSSEELLCEEQLDLLRDGTIGRQMTLEETKRLDLLVKNLHIIREKSVKAMQMPLLAAKANETLLIEAALKPEK